VRPGRGGTGAGHESRGRSRKRGTRHPAARAAAAAAALSGRAGERASGLPTWQGRGVLHSTLKIITG